ncbi:GNAT family N-acetyltransferase [Hydrogenimonas cancrithermarum]|nr:hypothetical protein [Hydrogenimonas cancrithermarum]
MLDQKKTLRFIADTHSDYSDFLIGPEDNTTLYEICKTIHDIIEQSDEVDSIELKNLNQSSKYLGIFCSRFDYKQILYQTNASSYTSFVGSENVLDAFSYLKAKKRNQIKRLYKKNENLHGVYHTVDTSPFPAETLKEILTDMKKSGLRGDDFLDETLLGIITKLYEAGHLMIQEIKDDKTSLVMNFILKDDREKRFLLWITIYRNRPKINILSYFILIKKLSMEHIGSRFVLDFGRGLYEYKIVNFLPEINLQFTFYYSKNGIAYVRYLLKQFIILSIKPFYKKHKKTINRILHR